MNIIEWLQGKKTYIVLVVAFVFNVGVAAGWWGLESELWAVINAILGFLGLGALKSAVKKTGK